MAQARSDDHAGRPPRDALMQLAKGALLVTLAIVLFPQWTTAIDRHRTSAHRAIEAAIYVYSMGVMPRRFIAHDECVARGVAQVAQRSVTQDALVATSPVPSPLAFRDTLPLREPPVPPQTSARATQPLLIVTRELRRRLREDVLLRDAMLRDGDVLTRVDGGTNPLLVMLRGGSCGPHGSGFVTIEGLRGGRRFVQVLRCPSEDGGVRRRFVRASRALLSAER